jgi:hypothetical protein
MVDDVDAILLIGLNLWWGKSKEFSWHIKPRILGN